MAERRELTPHEKACAERAKKMWLEVKKKRKLSQEKAAAEIGWSTSGLNQYLNGTIPLNTDATAKLAKFLGGKPRDIDPNWLADGEHNEDEKFEALLGLSDPQQITDAMRSIADRASPSDALKYARLFLDRVEAGL